MGMIKNGIKRLIKWAMIETEYESEPERATNYAQGSKVQSFGGGISISRSKSIDSPGGINFTVFSATGGKVIQLQTYDSRTDRTNTSLYVVTDQEDLAEELALIITRESLTR
jgi:hypothetical protein